MNMPRDLPPSLHYDCARVMLATIVSSEDVLLDANKALPRPICRSERNFSDSLIKKTPSINKNAFENVVGKWWRLFRSQRVHCCIHMRASALALLLLFSDVMETDKVITKWIQSNLCTTPSHVSAKHDDVIKWKHFPRYWTFVRGIHRSPVNSPHKGPTTRSFDVFFDVRLNKRLSKQSWGWWFEMPSRPLWRHCYGSQKTQHIRPGRARYAAFFVSSVCNSYNT